jgi:hypothetical protein
MTKPTITIHDVTTNKIVEREMNASEFMQYELDQTSLKAKKEAETQAAEAKAQILAKLGLTDAEAALLLS